MKDVNCLSWQCHRISDSFETFQPFWRALHTRPVARLAVLDARDILHLEVDNSSHEDDGAAFIWVIGEGRCDVNSKSPFVGSERGLAEGIFERCKYVLHVTPLFHISVRDRQKEFIEPSLQETEFDMRAAVEANITGTVTTSISEDTDQHATKLRTCSNGSAQTGTWVTGRRTESKDNGNSRTF